MSWGCLEAVFWVPWDAGHCATATRKVSNSSSSAQGTGAGRLDRQATVDRTGPRRFDCVCASAQPDLFCDSAMPTWALAHLACRGHIYDAPHKGPSWDTQRTT